jgi:hypothetical protein
VALGQILTEITLGPSLAILEKESLAIPVIDGIMVIAPLGLILGTPILAAAIIQTLGRIITLILAQALAQALGGHKQMRAGPSVPLEIEVTISPLLHDHQIIGEVGGMITAHSDFPVVVVLGVVVVGDKKNMESLVLVEILVERMEIMVLDSVVTIAIGMKDFVVIVMTLDQILEEARGILVPNVVVGVRL